MSYTHVDKPITIAGVELKNRIFRSAHGTILGRGGISDALIAYHEARARGGAALSVLEIGSVHWSTPHYIDLFDPVVDAGYLKLVERIRPYGMKVFQQLWHGGHHAVPRDRSPPWSASAIPSVEVGVVPIAMTKPMIDEVIEGYADCARRCEANGLDGVEIHCAHGYLPAQFLSPNTNRREDDYGGSFENRARFIIELLSAARSATSKNFAVGARFSPDLLANGLGPEENLRMAQMLEARGLIDFVSVSLGNYNSFDKMIGGMHEPVGYELPTSTQISRRIKLPTMVVGRFRTLEECDQVIRNGDGDMTGMVRAMIADPDLIVKSLAGRADQVRPCIACNQGCVARTGGHIECVVNPGTGHELYRGDHALAPAAKRRHVLVVGGGPAGMEAARVAALRGHKVTLAEADTHLGGMVRAAARAPTRHGMMDICNWLETEIFRLGVDVRLSSYMDADDVVAMDADAVIVATGSLPRMDGLQQSHPGQPIRNFDRANVISSLNLFMQTPVDLGRTAVVIDDVGHYEAMACAEFLIQRGLSVTYITRLRSFGQLMQANLMADPFLRRMAGKPFRALVRHRAIAIEEGRVIAGPAQLQDDLMDTVEVPADTVVFVSHNQPSRDLFCALDGKIADLHVVGDANSPRFLEAAFREGHVAGSKV